MVRWCFLFFTLLAIGMVTSIAVAVCCAHWSRPTTFAPGYVHIIDSVPEWVLDAEAREELLTKESVDWSDVLTDTGQTNAYFKLSQRIESPVLGPPLFDWAQGMIVEGTGVTWMQATRLPRSRQSSTIVNPGAVNSTIEKQYGWPWRCLTSGDHPLDVNGGAPGLINGPAVNQELLARYRGGPISQADHALNIPRAVMWDGLIGNTFIFALLWCVVLITFSTGRRVARHLRGRCLRCGYCLRGKLDTGCPECGWRRRAA